MKSIEMDMRCRVCKKQMLIFCSLMTPDEQLKCSECGGTGALVEPTPGRCQCETCLLSRRIQKFFPDMSADQKSVINELWNRMETAELDLNVIQAKKDGTWPVPEGDDE